MWNQPATNGYGVLNSIPEYVRFKARSKFTIPNTEADWGNLNQDSVRQEVLGI
jgi:hypothetical protein